MILNILSIAFKTQWRAINRSKWQWLGIVGTMLMGAVMLMYGYGLAMLLNNSDRLNVTLPENIDEIIHWALAVLFLIVFQLRNLLPSLKQKVYLIPSHVPVSNIKRVVADLLYDTSSPLFISFLIFLSSYAIGSDRISLDGFIYLVSSFLSSWIAGHLALTIIHKSFPKKLLITISGAIYATPGFYFHLQDFGINTPILTLVLPIIGLIHMNWAYTAGVENPKGATNYRTSGFLSVLRNFTWKDKKMRTLLMMGFVIKCFAIFYYHVVTSKSPDSSTSIMIQIYGPLVTSPVVVCSYFLANLWGMNGGLWSKMQLSGASTADYWRLHVKISTLPLVVELTIGMVSYLFLVKELEITHVLIAIVSLPMLQFITFLTSLWNPKKILKAFSFGAGNTVPIISSIVMFLTVLLLYLPTWHPAFYAGWLVLIGFSIWAWKYSESHYPKKETAIFAKLR